MNPCACTDIVRCAACTPYECTADDHYCPAWLTAADVAISDSGALTCRCGQPLQPFDTESIDGDGDGHVWVNRHIMWAATGYDADQELQHPFHDTWIVFDEHIVRTDGGCQAENYYDNRKEPDYEELPF